MHQTLIQCTAILSAVSIAAVGATAKACQTSDLLFREEHIESDTIFKLNVIEKTLQSRSTTSFFDENYIKFVGYQLLQLLPAHE